MTQNDVLLEKAVEALVSIADSLKQLKALSTAKVSVSPVKRTASPYDLSARRDYRSLHR